MGNNEILLAVKDLEVLFETDRGTICAVDRISFDLNKGRILGIVGETGCGKSVTARAILRVLPSGSWVQTSGQIFFQNREILSLPEKEMQRLRGSAISMIFQEPGAALNPTIKIGLQVSEVISNHLGGSRAQIWRQTIDILRRVGIPGVQERAHFYPHQLSGGMKQRSMIAGAIACRPSLLIADEPTTALDVTIQSQILELIIDLRNSTGMAVLLISHDLGTIAETCDEVAVMYSGRIVERSPVQDFFTGPRHPYSQGLIQAIPMPGDDREWLPIIPGRVTNQPRVKGCNFADRCSYAEEKCTAEFPPWLDDGSHQVLCCKPLR